MTMTNQCYSLQDFQNIMFQGFHFELPPQTIQLITELTNQVGSPTYVKTPVFMKREPVLKNINSSYDSLNDLHDSSSSFETLHASSPHYERNSSSSSMYSSSLPSSQSTYHKKRRGKNMEVTSKEDWETLRTFHKTKIEKKTGIELQFDQIRSYLNKMTDKNTEEIKTKVIQVVEEMRSEKQELSEKEDCVKQVGKQIFEITTLHRLHSKRYAYLYHELVCQYPELNMVGKEEIQLQIENIYQSILEISYVDPSKDYNEFCRITKENEKRRAACEFIVHLLNFDWLDRSIGSDLLLKLLELFMKNIQTENKKNEVDEMTELIFILYNGDYLKKIDERIRDNIEERVVMISNCKVKDFVSLTNKSIFKFMDMIDA